MRSVEITVQTGVAELGDEESAQEPSSGPSADADADDDEEQDDENDQSQGPGGEQEKASKRRPWRRAAAALATPRRWIRSAIRWVAAVLLGAVLAAAGYAGWLLYQQHQTDIDARQALDAAKQYAVTLTSTDPNAVDTNFNDILNGATGEFKDQYTKAGSLLLRKAMIDNKVATHGTVLDSAVKSASPHRVEVLLFVEQSVTNSSTPNRESR